MSDWFLFIVRLHALLLTQLACQRLENAKSSRQPRKCVDVAVPPDTLCGESAIRQQRPSTVGDGRRFELTEIAVVLKLVAKPQVTAVDRQRLAAKVFRPAEHARG